MMALLFVTTLTVILEVFQVIALQTTSDGACLGVASRRNTLNLSVDRKLNQSDGQWTTTFSARRVATDNSETEMIIEATHGAILCEGIKETHVELVVRDTPPMNYSITEKVVDGGFVFHHRHGSNVVLFNGGLSAQRINLENAFNSAVFTNRPLKDNEIFQVRLDKRTDHKPYCAGIGVMAHSPDEVKLEESIYYSDGTWIYYDDNVYGGKKVVVPKYGVNLCNTQAGDVVGVMRRDNGSLHFLVKGVDQGPAIKNAPSVLYGVYEVRGFAVIATIVK